MNDRFKFRVWLPFEKRMITTDNESFFALNQHGSLLKINDKNEVFFARIGHTFSKENIMQCTGLKDKNGKLIYEGDIIKYLSGTVNKKFVKYITKWNDNMGQFYISKINPSEYDNWKDWHLGRHDLDYEIIGNIYENKELLNEN